MHGPSGNVSRCTGQYTSAMQLQHKNFGALETVRARLPVDNIFVAGDSLGLPWRCSSMRALESQLESSFGL